MYNSAQFHIARNKAYIWFVASPTHWLLFKVYFLIQTQITVPTNIKIRLLRLISINETQGEVAPAWKYQQKTIYEY